MQRRSNGGVAAGALVRGAAHRNELTAGRAEGGPYGPAQARHRKIAEQEEDHHLFHTQGWCRELWIQSLGMPAVLPPPEEVKQVETAIGASRAEQQREEML